SARGLRRRADPGAVEAARADLRHRPGPARDREPSPAHPELAQLALRLAGEPVRRRAPALRERDGGLDQLGLERAQRLLLGRQDFLVPLELLELGRHSVPECEHRGFGVPVLPLEPRERVEPLVDLFQTSGRDRHPLPELADSPERVLDQGAGAVDRVGGRREGRVEPRELAQQTTGAMQPARRRALVLVEESADLGEPRDQPLSVLKAPVLGAQLLFLALSQPGAVELRELKAQEILALRAIALGGPQALDLRPRRAMPRDDVAHPLAQLLCVAEAVQEIELAGRLQQALVLVLAVDLDQVVAD